MASEQLQVCAPPQADLRLFETQKPLLPDGVTVERYTTARGFVFEKHIAPSGVVHWFRVVKNGA
jgi:hypothetical protein